MSKRKMDLTGKRFGRWTVLGFAYKNNSRCPFWKCRCECGTEKNIARYSLIDNKSKSCGCLRDETATKHGMHNTRFYHIWQSMRQRCQNTNDKDYKNYGGRGIQVCNKWNEFKNFYNDTYKQQNKYHHPLHILLHKS